MDETEYDLVLSELQTPDRCLGSQQEQGSGATRFYFLHGVYQDSTDQSSSDCSDVEPAPLATKCNTKAVADDAGDLILTRKRRRAQKFISIRHSALPTTVGDVGLQVWRGACLLCDWLLSRPSEQPGPSLVLELGGGVGLVGIAAAVLSDHVLITDVHQGALSLAAANVAANTDLVAWCRRRRRQPAGGRAQRHSRRRQRVLGREPGEVRSGGRGSDGDTEGTDMEHTEGPHTEGQRGPLVEVARLDWFDFLSFSDPNKDAVSVLNALVAEEQKLEAAEEEGTRGNPDQQSTAPDEAGAATASAAAGAPASWQAGRTVTRGSLARVARAVAQADSLYLVAADTVYDTVLTEAFVRCAAALMAFHRATVPRRQGRRRQQGPGCAAASPGQDRAEQQQQQQQQQQRHERPYAPARLVVGMEKRLNFTLHDLAVSATAFDDFLSYVLVEGGSPAGREGSLSAGADSSAPVGGGACSERWEEPGCAGPREVEAAAGAPEGDEPCVAGEEGLRPDAPQRRPLFRGRRLNVNLEVPQVLHYERCAQLELWELTLL